MLSLDDIHMTSILFHAFQRGKFTDVRGCFSYPSLLRQDAESSLQVRVQSGAGKPGLRHQLGSFCSLNGMGCHLHTLWQMLEIIQLTKQKGLFVITVWDILSMMVDPIASGWQQSTASWGKLLIEQYWSCRDQEAKKQKDD